MSKNVNKRWKTRKKAIQSPVPQKIQKPGIKQTIEKWCGSHAWITISLIIILSAVIRIAYFTQLNGCHLINQHEWSESDMFVFDQWADAIEAGDILSEQYVQPEHNWMKRISTIFFKDHPDRFEYYKNLAGPDTLENSPSRMLWIDWYGKKAFPHEPLYAYFVALNYKIFGKEVRWVFVWQMMLGILTNLLVFLVARKYFGELSGVIAAFLVVFCGPLLFYELTLLRSTFAAFFTILVVYITGSALQKKTLSWWIAGGAACGLSATVHAYFVLLAIIWYIFLSVYFYKNWKTLGTAAVGFGLGLLLVLSPIMIRNARMNLPLLNLSNNSAIGFITMNNNTFKSFKGWMVEPQYVSDIMYTTGGDLFKTIIPTLKTHKDLASYLGQVWDKLHATFSWYEIPNNVNFYFYRQFTPVLHLTFISFLIISPFALVGLCLAMQRRKQAWPLYVMLLVLMVSMLAFMVLSRYRIVFSVVLIPFAAFTIAELFTAWKGWKNIALSGAVIGIALWTSAPRNEQTVKVVQRDYVAVFRVHFEERIQKEVTSKDWNKAADLYDAYIKQYQPDEITDMKPFYRCKDRHEAEIWSFFASMHERRSKLLHMAADSVNAKREADAALNLKNASGL